MDPSRNENTTHASWLLHSTCVVLMSHVLPVVVSVLSKLKLRVAVAELVVPKSTYTRNENYCVYTTTW